MSAVPAFNRIRSSSQREFTFIRKPVPGPVAKNSLRAWNTISDASIQRAASRLGLPVAAIRTVAEVETRGGGFIAPGKPTILFERHKFSALTGHEFDAEYPDISSPSAGGYGKGGEHQYDRLNLAMTLDSSAALKSASWGQFQILGMNYKQAGFNSLEDFVSANQQSSDRQLDAFVTFIQNDSKLLDALAIKTGPHLPTGIMAKIIESTTTTQN